MAINEVVDERVYHVRDILREFLGHNFVSGIRTLKPKIPKHLITFSKKPSSFPALARVRENF